MSNLPSRIISKLAKLEKEFVKYPFDQKLKQLRQKYDDASMNRELLVVDKYGNRYYQQYSNEGIPIKRYVALNFKAFNKWDDDPTMQSWLQFRRESPPTQEELEKIYIQQEEYERKGLEWDRKEQKLIEEYKFQRNKAINAERKETGSIGEDLKFEPGKWKSQNALSEIDYKSQQLAELPKWDVMEYENIYGLKGKYLVDFHNDDKEWMEKKCEQRLLPYQKVLDVVDMSQYNEVTMSKRHHDRKNSELMMLKEKKSELSNIGRKMLEKKGKYKAYSDFRIRFKDVFESIEFGI